MSKLSDLESKLEQYRDKLDFIQEPDRLVIRCIKYIYDKKFWDEIDSIIRGEGGRYVAKDKGGPEWRLPSLTAEEQKKLRPSVDVASRLDGIISELQRLRKEIGGA